MCLPPMIRAVIRAESRSGFVAECADIPVHAEGVTTDEVIKNLRVALQTYLERAENPFADYVLIVDEASAV